VWLHPFWRWEQLPTYPTWDLHPSNDTQWCTTHGQLKHHPCWKGPSLQCELTSLWLQGDEKRGNLGDCAWKCKILGGCEKKLQGLSCHKPLLVYQNKMCALIAVLLACSWR
jgi:hypothetical protein